MTMTMADKERCAEIFSLYTDIDIPANRWNESAANMLAQMVSDIRNCSQGMAAARAVWPSTSKISWLWLVKIPWHLIKNEYKLNKGYVNKSCLNAALLAYEDAIQWEIMK